MFFLKNIIWICNKKNISQNNLAKQTGIATSTIKNIFQGKIKNPTLDNAYKISKFLNIDLITLIEIDLERNDS